MHRRNFVALVSWLSLGLIGNAAPHPRARENRLDEQGGVIHEAIEKICERAGVDPHMVQIQCWHQGIFDLSSGKSTLVRWQRMFHLSGRLNSGHSLYISDETLSGAVRRAHEALAKLGM